jgi:hypothetical protein
MDALSTGSLQSWLVVAAAALSPLIACTDRWFRWQLGEKGGHARLQGAKTRKVPR